MDHFADERDLKVLEGDKYSFFVMRKILPGQHPILLSDHKRLILCFSGHPHPVWIWTPDDASETEMEAGYRLAKDNGLLNGAYHFNVKYELAEYFIRRAAKDGRKLSLTMNMLTYDCRNPIKPEAAVDGIMHRCGPGDLDEMVEFMTLFHEEVGIDKRDREFYRTDAKTYLEQGNTYFWKNAEGKNVAVCKYGPNGEMASLSLVYTLPEYRRKHYAENLVYQVTVKAIEQGYVPMLYTNADYEASNACYRKVGYALNGKLCTIG